MNPLSQPPSLSRVGDVLDLVGDGAAVGVLELGVDVGKRLAGEVRPQDARRDRGHRLGCEVLCGFQCRIPDGRVAKRVQRRRKMTVVAVSLQQAHRRRGCSQGGIVSRAGRCCRRHARRGGGEGRHARGLECRDGDAQAVGDVLVESVLALEVQIDLTQERSAFGTLDDPVVVGARCGHDLLDPERRGIDVLEANGERD